MIDAQGTQDLQLSTTDSVELDIDDNNTMIVSVLVATINQSINQSINHLLISCSWKAVLQVNGRTEKKHRSLSESARFCGIYDINILLFFSIRSVVTGSSNVFVSHCPFHSPPQSQLCNTSAVHATGGIPVMSVCPPVRHTPVLRQNEERRGMRCSPSSSPVSLVFWCQEWLMGDDPVHVKFECKEVDPLWKQPSCRPTHFAS